MGSKSVPQAPILGTYTKKTLFPSFSSTLTRHITPRRLKICLSLRQL